MGLIEVDGAQCDRDGACMSSCPVGILQMDAVGAVPRGIEGMEFLCLECGHCVAVCPKQALSHRSISPDQCRPVRRQWQLGPDQAEQFLRARRSVRVYKDRLVEPELLERVINLAQYAPSSLNSQATGWLVISGRHQVRHLAEIGIGFLRSLVQNQPEMAKGINAVQRLGQWDEGTDIVCRRAPAVIVAHGLASDPMGPSDAALALNYLQLVAPTLGLGTCWLGIVHVAATVHLPMQRYLNFPKGRACYGVVAIGYPQFEFGMMPPRKPAQIIWR